MVGYNYEQTTWERLQAGNSDFNFDDILWNNLGSGSYLAKGKASMGTGKSLAKLIGVFGRINYNWKNLLIASASIRYEGSTKFGADHKWGAFPSLSLAWEMANMGFLKRPPKHRSEFETPCFLWCNRSFGLRLLPVISHLRLS